MWRKSIVVYLKRERSFRESKGGNTDFQGISGLKRDFCAPKINLLKNILEGLESKGNGAKKHDEIAKNLCTAPQCGQ